jgi:tetratricopeptide (TPR) repeat protein
MQTGNQLPFISQKSVRLALDAFLYSSATLDSPLLFLLLVEEFLLNPDLPAVSNPREYALAQILNSVITAEFSRRRQIFHLERPGSDDARENILSLVEEDAKIASPELIGWSWLYHHFVRVDLNFSQQEFCDIIHIDGRTLRRYQTHILKRLTDLLIDLEWKARNTQRKRRLVSELPSSSMFPIIGREHLIQNVSQILSELQSPHIQISGAKGVGKTTFVESVLRKQIDNGEIDQLVWIDTPSTCDFVRQFLVERLMPTQVTIGLREYCQMYRTVVVLDGIELLYADYQALGALLKLLAGATVFLICNYHEPLTNTVQIALHELDHTNACNLIRYFFTTINGYEEVNEDTVQLVWDRVGGNPFAVQLTVLNWLRINIEGFTSNIGLDAIFAYIFESIEYSLKCTWIALAAFSSGKIEYEELRKIWPQHITSQNISLLVGYHLLRVSVGRSHYYSLLESARNYIQECYKNDPTVRGIVEQLIEDLDNADVANIKFIENILMNDWVVIEEIQRTLWISRWWRIGISTGHWSIWRLLLEVEANSDAPDIDLAIGYATCLRHLGEVEGARKYLVRLVEHLGRIGEFAKQGVALLELAVVERQSGAYESAASFIAAAERISARFSLNSLYEKIIIEQSQIAVDTRDIESFAQLIDILPDSPRGNLLKSEMLFLGDDVDRSKQVAGSVLSALAFHPTTQAHAHDILGRVYEHLGDLPKAEEHFSWCLIILERSDDSFSIARAQSNLGSVLLHLKHYEEAEILLTNAESRQLLLNDRVGAAATQHNLKQLHIKIATSS